MAQIRTDVNKKEMIQSLKRHKGCVKDACDETGIGRSTHYRWIEEDAEYRDSVLDITEGIVDFAENKLRQLIEEGDTTATIFFLKTKGKKRGYVERNEIEVTDSVIKVIRE